MDDKLERVLAAVDKGKRGFLKKLLVGTAFVIPTVASFSMDGLSMYQAHAQGSNLPGGPARR